MTSRVRSLTAQEIEKLPQCRYSWDSHTKCFEIKQPQETKACLRCCMEGMIAALGHEDNIAVSVHCLDGLAIVLKELKMLE